MNKIVFSFMLAALFITVTLTSCKDDKDSDLSGTIVISPSTGVFTGMELTAIYSGNEKISYQWKKDGNNVGTDLDKFTPTEIGSYTVTVSASGYNSKTSDAVTVTEGTDVFFTVSFDADGGIPAPADQTVREDGTATEPMAPIKVWIPVAGLYQGVLPEYYSFDGWFLEGAETPFVFSTKISSDIKLKARWSSIEPVATVVKNDVEAALAHIGGTAGEWNLLLDGNATVSDQLFVYANVDLTISGIGSPRTISSQIQPVSDLRMFFITNNGKLTLGKNTIFTNSVESNSNLFFTGGDANGAGTLVMLDGSEISSFITTDGPGAIWLMPGTFIMEGGKITGNTNKNTANHACMVRASIANGFGSKITIKGGVIKNNTSAYDGGIQSDIFLDDNTNPPVEFTISGDPEIGTVMLWSNDVTRNASISISGTFSGSLQKIDLWGGSSVEQFWVEGKQIIKGAAAADISKFSLGIFRAGTGAIPLSDYEINAAGQLVKK